MWFFAFQFWLNLNQVQVFNYCPLVQDTILYYDMMR